MRSEPDESGATSLTQLLKRAADGDAAAAEALLPLVYDELRGLARARMVRLAPGQTIQATELVHEAWMRVVASGEPGWDSRAHFFGAAARAMRNILVERARKKGSLKRGSGRKQALGDFEPAITTETPIDDVLSLHTALGGLEEKHPRPARVVSLRYFAGLSMTDAAEVAGISLATAERDWRFAKAWLQSEMDT